MSWWRRSRERSPASAARVSMSRSAASEPIFFSAALLRLRDGRIVISVGLSATTTNGSPPNVREMIASTLSVADASRHRHSSAAATCSSFGALPAASAAWSSAVPARRMSRARARAHPSSVIRRMSSQKPPTAAGGPSSPGRSCAIASRSCSTESGYRFTRPKLVASSEAAAVIGNREIHPVLVLVQRDRVLLREPEAPACAARVDDDVATVRKRAWRVLKRHQRKSRRSRRLSERPPVGSLPRFSGCLVRAEEGIADLR